MRLPASDVRLGDGPWWAARIIRTPSPACKGRICADERGQECPRVLVRDVREENRSVRKGPAARITVNHARLSRACVMKLLHEADIAVKAHIDRARAIDGALHM